MSLKSCIVFITIFVLNFVLIWSENVNYLTKHFFENLKNDPKLTENELTESAKTFIDKQIGNYLNLVKQTHTNNKHSVSRRSLPIDDMESYIHDDYGVFKLKTVRPLYRVGGNCLKDVVLFTQKSSRYVATLESDEPSLQANHLIIYKEQNSTFVELQRKNVQNGLEIEVHPIRDGFTYVIVAENNTKTKTNIYIFEETEKLSLIQRLNVNYASSAVIWKQDETFMAISQQMLLQNDTTNYEIETPIYKWRGKHFDEIQRIKTYNNRKMMPFTIGNAHYLAVANFQNNRGATNVLSEIFKYDLNTEIFVPHQKISTQGAVDVKFFCYTFENLKDSFLVFANFVDRDSEGDENFDTTSVVYKHVDDYFIPFQSFELTAPTQWLPVAGPRGEFALFVACKFDGAKVYQYNGWKFVEVQVDFDGDAFTKGIISIRSTVFGNELVISVVNEKDNGDAVNVFELDFVHENNLKAFHEEMLQWCSDALQITAETRTKRSTPPRQQVNHIRVELDQQMDRLKTIESALENTLQTPELTDTTADLVIAKNNLNIDNLLSSTLNDFNTISLLQNTIDTENGFVLSEPLRMNVLKVDRPLTPLVLNGHPFQNLVRKNRRFHLQNLNVDGNVIFASEVSVSGNVNGIKIDPGNVLLVHGDQHIPGQINIENVVVDELVAEKLETGDVRKEPVLVRSVDTLVVRNLTLGGFLNEVHMPTLDRFALRTFGNQTIETGYIFDNLHTEKLEIIGLLSEKKVPDDIIRTKEGTYTVTSEVQFANTLNTDRMDIKTRMNHIEVKNGKLDVLLVNTKDVQHVTGRKVVDGLVLLKPVTFRTGINGNKELEKMNPVKNVEQEVELKGDYIVLGDVTVEKLLTAEDVRDSTQLRSLRRLQTKGLRITQEQVPEMEFTQQISVENAFVSKINHVDARTFAVTGTENPVTVTGWKIFLGDISITGPTTLINVNDVNIPTLHATTFKTDGDQILTGSYVFETMNTNRVTSSSTTLGVENWRDVFTTDTLQTISGTTRFERVKLKRVKTGAMTAEGFVNNRNFTALVRDTATSEGISHLFGHKQFDNLSVENLIVENGIDLDKLPDTLTPNQTYTMDGDVVLMEPTVENVYFSGSCNGLPRHVFNKMWQLSDGDVIEGDMHFESITVIGNADILSDMINSVSVSGLVGNTVKVDEPHYFNSAVFDGQVASTQNVELKGNIVGLDLENVIHSESSQEQIFEDTLTFLENVTVNGTLTFKGLLNDVNLTQVCTFTASQEMNKTVVVNGSAVFVKGPVLQYINGLNVPNLLENSWFRNTKTALSGYLQFDNIQFREHVTARFIDGTDLSYLTDNYLSKTKNQTVLAHLKFDDIIIFTDGLSAPEATVTGDVYGVDLGEFQKTALLDGVDQVFEEPVYLQNVRVESLMGEHTLNDFDVNADLFRYDRSNAVTGRKILENVYVEALKINPDVKVQDVEFVNWLKNVVFKGGSLRIQGRKVFKGRVQFEQGISLQGLLNGRKFDSETVMLKSVPQNITGKKAFVDNPEEEVYFKDLHLKGLLNKYNLTEELRNQVNVEEDVQLYSPVVFNGTLNAENVNVEGLYQGIEVVKFLKNLTHVSEFSNYNENYDHLLKISKRIKGSFEDQAFFLSHYDIMQSYPAPSALIPMAFNGKHHLAVVYPENGTTGVYFARWSDTDGKFIGRDMAMNMQIKSVYAVPITFPERDYVYVEGVSLDGLQIEGVLMWPENETSLDMKQIETEQCQSVSSLVLLEDDRKEYCLVMVFVNPVEPKVWCDFEGEAYVLQTFERKNAYKVTTIDITGTPHVILMSGGTEDMGAEIEVWKYDRERRQFDLIQEIYAIAPNSISAIDYNGIYYLAISSGYVPNALHEEAVDIMRFDPQSNTFTRWQTLKIKVPIEVQLVVLPSNELMLYVLTDNVGGTLMVFEYEGISGFTKKMVASAIPKVHNMRQFTTKDYKHFVILEGQQEVQVLEAVFKGERMRG